MEFDRFENATSRGLNNSSIMSSPRRENFLIERKFTGFQDEDEIGLKSLSDFNGLFVDEDVPVEVDFEKQAFMVGNRAK